MCLQETSPISSGSIPSFRLFALIDVVSSPVSPVPSYIFILLNQIISDDLDSLPVKPRHKAKTYAGVSVVIIIIWFPDIDFSSEI